jgi:hypothetical protein
MRRTTVLAIIMLLSVGAIPAAAQDAAPEYAEQSVFFRCVGGQTAKVQNQSSPTPWGAERPTQSVRDGAGCGFVDVGREYNDGPSSGQWDPVYSGKVKGNIRNLTADVHLLGHGNETLIYDEMTLFIWLVVDGVSLYYGPDPVTVPHVAENSGATQRLSFSLTGLERFIQAEPGLGQKEHTVELTVAPWFGDEVIPWVWGTTEVPAGITFNDATLAPTVVPVLPGDGG